MTTVPPRRRHNWIWFFLFLLLLGGTALTIEIWYNLRQQMTLAQLEDARVTWQQNGPRDYDFIYNVTRQTRTPGDIVITSRDGRPTTVRVDSADWEPSLAPLYDLGPALTNLRDDGSERETRTPGQQDGVTHEYRVRVREGRAVEVRCDGKVIPAVDPEAYRMEGLFAALHRQLELDSEPGRPRVFAVGTFGKGDRRLLRYVRSCRAVRERVEIKFVELTPLTTPARDAAPPT